jgi:hypothetical protein
MVSLLEVTQGNRKSWCQRALLAPRPSSLLSKGSTGLFTTRKNLTSNAPLLPTSGAPWSATTNTPLLIVSGRAPGRLRRLL